MIKEVIMPKLGQTMEEGIIEKWRKKEGEKVEKGDILLDITTDKATLEVESYVTGILRKIVHNEGETVPVTQIIAYIGDEGDKVPDVTEEKKKPVEPAKQEVREVKAAQQEEKVEAERAVLRPLRLPAVLQERKK